MSKPRSDAATPSLSPTSGATGRWIIGPVSDLTLILLTPLLMLAVFAYPRQVGSTGPLIAFGFVLSMGHYLPGMMRAYGDPQLLRRFWLRLTVVPILLFTVVTFFAYYRLQAVTWILLMWGGWHWMMQIYGFGRIYDAKAKSFAKMTARLDHALCFFWFYALSIFYNGGVLGLTSFYQSGGPQLPAEWIRTASSAWWGVTYAVTAIYVLHTIRLCLRGTPPNPLKLVMYAGTIAFLGYTVTVIETPFLGYILFESCHDIQYLALVWFVNRNRAQTDAKVGSFIQFLFRPRAVLVALYIGVCLAFGSISLLRNYGEGLVTQWATIAFMVFAMLHYYLDGFIWKIRETDTRTSLGVLDGAAGGGRMSWLAQLPLGWRHATLWLLFLVPAAWLGYAQWQERGPAAANHEDRVARSKAKAERRLQIADDVAAAFPDSALSHFNLCSVLVDQKIWSRAVASCAQTVVLQPGWPQAERKTGMAFLGAKELRKAEKHFIKALDADPGLTEARLGLAFVYAAAQRLAEAENVLKTALQHDPQSAAAHFALGELAFKQGKRDVAQEHFLKAVARDANHVRAHYRLAGFFVGSKDHVAAIHHYGRVVDLDSTNLDAHNRLAWYLGTHPDDDLRDGRRAVLVAQQAATLTQGMNASTLDTLAAAHAEAGEFDHAVTIARRALKLATERGNAQLTNRIRARLQKYQQGQPHRSAF